MAQHLRIANTGSATRSLDDFTETQTSKDIWRSLDMVRSINGTAMTMISGAPGVGKTLTVKQFCRSLGHDAIYMQAAKGEGTAWNFAIALAGGWGYHFPHFNTLAQARQTFTSYIGKGSLVVIDEAQYLNQRNARNGLVGEAYEWFRGVAEDGRFDVVFCGDLTLASAIQSFPQLNSRMRRPIVIKAATENDVKAVAGGSGFESRATIRVLHAVAVLPGGLRNVENVLRTAIAFAGSEQPNQMHLKAAVVDMKLSPKGGA